MEFLALSEALHFAQRLGFHVVDHGLLDSALARPASEMFGIDAYPTLELKAAALHQSLIKNHALADGNKRFAWILLNTFLELNGFELVMSEDDAFDLTIGVAEDRYQLPQAADIIRRHLAAH